MITAQVKNDPLSLGIGSVAARALLREELRPSSSLDGKFVKMGSHSSHPSAPPFLPMVFHTSAFILGVFNLKK